MLFEQLGLIEPLLKALKTEGYTTPTPIQQQSIPVVLKEKDLLGCAQTGTGKTAAFALPILQLLYAQQASARGPRPIRSLILTPTRELAIQIEESFTAYGRHTGLKHTAIFGGVSQHAQVNTLRNGVDTLIATPGRLLDLITQNIVSLQHLQIFVLDEADRMLDMGFIHDVKKIIARLPRKRQTLFFSATMPPAIADLANTLLTAPTRVDVAPVSSTAEKVEQAVYFVNKGDKPSLLVHILETTPASRSLVFTRTKHGANKVANALNKAGINADAIHGNKSQNARQRALTDFKSGHLRVLVATDIAARGIDIDDLTHVINYELPNVPETYVHRIGRTGRAGNEGLAISFCDAEERAYLKDITKLIAKSIPVVEEHPFHSNSTAITATPNVQRNAPSRQGGRSNPGSRPQGSRPQISRPNSGEQRERNWNRSR